VQKLSFEAPTEPGVYPYVCTYPGHWRRMYGALYVVADLDGYLADPEGYLESNPLPIRDKLLEFNRPRTEWKFQDLAASVEMMADGRSFANGKQIFEVASCVACHKLNGAGVEVGPDLAKLDAMFTPLDILQELIDPSKRINEDFQSFTFALSSGQVVTGLVLEETPEAVKVVENPLAKSEPLVISTDQIEQRAKSTTSIMPEGLLDKLTHEEILDLIAYIAARGSEQHPLFTPGEGQQHEHHH
jgi:putative heme-binding domain-containing protein